MKKKIAVYKLLIEDISEQVKEGIITENDKIQVLRTDKPMMQDYRPIVDWYYDAFTMKEEIETPLEEMYMEEEFTKEEWKEMHEDLEKYKKQYLSEKDKLEEMGVKAALTEMKQMQKLFG
ncbi:MAG: hypothetical protein MJ116_09335 [Lachnospiraceae bacterium]|nr:hypothetical protein [Lachnospiraceae bacterium]